LMRVILYMQSYTINEEATIYYEPSDQHNHLMTDHIYNEYLITKAYGEAEYQNEDIYMLHHAYVGQPYDTSHLVNGVPFNYEIKDDAKSVSTGNLFFEYEDGKENPSGYKLSSAWQIHYWLILSGNTLIRLTAPDLYTYLAIDDEELIKDRKCYKNGKLSSRGKVININKLLDKEWCNSYNLSSGALSLNKVPSEYRKIFR
jgi:hypothetical protein